MNPSDSTPQKLIPVGDLLSEAFDLFSTHFSTLLVLNILAFGAWMLTVLVALLGVLPALLLHDPLYLIALAASVPLAGLPLYWALRFGISLPLSLAERASGRPLKELISLSSGKVLSYAWLQLIAMLVVLGGILLFFVPGIYISVAITFALWIYLFEGKRGVDALAASFTYVHGRWWGVFGRGLLLVLISSVIGRALTAVAGKSALVAFGVQLLWSFAFNLYGLCYSYLLFKSAAATYDRSYQPSTLFIKILLAVGTLVGLALVVGLPLLAFTLFVLQAHS